MIGAERAEPERGDDRLVGPRHERGDGGVGRRAALRR